MSAPTTTTPKSEPPADRSSRRAAGRGSWIGGLRRLASKEVGLSLLVLVVFLAAWEWLPGIFGWPDYIIPPASRVVEEFFRAFGPERLAYHTWITALEVVIGFSLGALLGMMIGFILGTSPTTEVVLSPYILALQIAPKVAFAPLFVMWFGFTLSPRILVAVLIVFFPIMVNVLSAMRSIDPAMINLARSFNATRTQIFRKIEFPAALPSLFAGLRIGSTLAVIGVVVGEFAGGNQGVGVVLNTAAGAANTPLVFACILLLTLIGILAYVAIVALEARVLHYMPKRELGHVGNP